ncbi:MAG: hypothetical protein HZA91_12425 [Verrucomicrobia bacterium]|nr:hypothetical protein [Verrucomicrobiota bacterium]
MNRIVKCANGSLVAVNLRNWLLIGATVLCAGGLAVAADEAQSSSQAPSPAVSSTQTDATPAPAETLPLMIPAEKWSRLTLTVEQQAQLQALRASLYQDQLATIRGAA